MRIPVSILSVLCLAAGSAAVPSESSARKHEVRPDTLASKPVVVGKTFTFPSKICGKDRTVMVSLPAGYETGGRRYPVFVVVDGQWNFNLAQHLKAIHSHAVGGFNHGRVNASQTGIGVDQYRRERQHRQRNQ